MTLFPPDCLDRLNSCDDIRWHNQHDGTNQQRSRVDDQNMHRIQIDGDESHVIGLLWKRQEMQFHLKDTNSEGNHIPPEHTLER